MLPLSANPDFKDVETQTIVNPYYDINGDKMGTEIDVYGVNALDQAIEMVLCTEPYERLFNTSFSSPLYQILFQNAADVDGIMTVVFDRIEYWVPIIIDRESAEVEFIDQDHTLRFKIPYISRDGTRIHTFNRLISK